VTQTQFRRLLDYTLNFYRYGDATSRFYGKKICAGAGTTAACRAVKSNLQARMIDQQIVDGYAKSHHLMPSLADWTVAKEEEQLLIRKLGGQAYFSKYLRKLGVAEFQFIEGLQIETRKAQRAIGSEARFKQWLRARRAAIKPVRCSLKGI
jgi:beta-lactamase class A